MDRLSLISRAEAKSMVGGQRWFTYDQIFTALQFTSRVTTTKSQLEHVEVRGNLSNKRITNHYKVFFDIYKPVTKFKKTDPPPPDFKIAVVK